MPPKPAARPVRRAVRPLDDGMLPKWWPLAAAFILCGGAYLLTLIVGSAAHK